MPLLALFMLADTTRAYAVPVAKAELLWVTEMGRGAPVVLIPGLFGSAYGFRQVLPLLAERGYRAIVVEPLGIGRSAKPERGDYSLTAQSDRVATVLQQLQVRNAIIVAHSLNASVAYRLAYRRPELVGAVVSLDGGPAERATTSGFRRAMTFVPWIKWFGGVKLIRKQIRKGLIKVSGDTTWVTDQVVDGYTAGAQADLDGTLKAFLAMAASQEREKLLPHLPEIRCPVRLLLGGARHDGGPPRSELEALRSGLSRLAVDTIAGAGHYIHEEQPQAVVEAVERAARALAGVEKRVSYTAGSQRLDAAPGLRCAPNQATMRFSRSSRCFSSCSPCGSRGYTTNWLSTPYRLSPRYSCWLWPIGSVASFSPWRMRVGVRAFLI